MSIEGSYDVVIVGGGAAGLSAAVALGRSMRSVLVIDAGEPRNAPSPSAHNVLGHEGVAPLDLLARGRREAAAFGVQLRSGTATNARREGDGFAIRLAGAGEVAASTLMIATGVRDELPEIEGLARLWGTSVLHCPYCHGWEVRGERIGVIATNANAAHQVQLFRQLSDRVTMILHDVPSPDGEQLARLTARGVAVVPGPVLRVSHEGGVLTGVELASGQRLDFDALVVGPRPVPRAELFEQLGGTLIEHPMGAFRYIETDAAGRTALPGVWAVGNSRDLAATVAVAAAQGMWAGAQLNGELVERDVQTALAEMDR